jgi:hypothetical protein
MPTLISSLPRGISRRSAVFAALTCLCLALGAAAPAQVAPPPITLAPITVGNGVATVTGTLGGTPTATANVTVNGQPVGVNAAGSFNATVDLSGQSLVTVAVKNPTNGEVFTLAIPISLAGTGGVIPGNVLDALKNAGISITIPPNGLQILDGQPLTITGSVLNGSELASLTINGSPVQPGSNGTFTEQLPGNTREVTVVATDRQGVSQTSTFPVEQLTSTIKTSAGTSISALGAKGLRITSVRYLTKGVKAKKRVTAIVTVKDTRGFLVRDAIVRLAPAGFQYKAVIGGQQVKTSTKIGQARFLLRVRAASFPKAKRLFTVATARTPKATARKQTSVRLPKLTPKKRSGR